jgi:hypothetical protein
MTSGRDRLIESINLLTGRRDCIEAVLAEQRHAWELACLPAGLLFVVMHRSFDLAPIATGLAVGAVAFVAFIFRRTYWVIGRTATHVVIARANATRTKARELSHTLPHPVSATVTPGWMRLKTTINDHQYYLARAHEHRFRSVVAGAAPARHPMTPPAP